MFSYYRMCSLIAARRIAGRACWLQACIECVLLLQNVFSYCSSPHRWACVAGYKPGENEDDPCEVDDDEQVGGARVNEKETERERSR